MNPLNLIQLKQLRFDVASQFVLQEWQPEDLSKPKCSKCGAKGFQTPYGNQEAAVCYCIRCNYYFRAVPLDRHCLCVTPGQEESRCLGCPNFERFIQLVRKRLPALELLSFEELLCLKTPL
jgi:hypothetical protein